MLFFPGSKINLGLQVGGKRPDGYHFIQSLFYPTAFTDILEVLPSSKDQFLCTGIVPEGPAESNLVHRAWKLYAQEFRLPPLYVHLHKVIPPGTGLGGGSADAVCMLKACDYFNRGEAGPENLFQMALQLGSDCPFFVSPASPALVSGRGEELENASVDLSGSFIMIVHQGIHISTAEAYAELDARPSAHMSLFEPEDRNRGEWKKLLQNAFEGPAFRKYPEIKKAKEQFYDAGAYYASMTGSGSAVFGLFTKDPGKRFPGTIYTGML